MKKLVSLLLVLSLLLGCASMASAKALTPLVIGATTSPHAEILEAIKDDLAALGYELDIVEYTEYPLPNPALASGDLDANYFQHIPYMQAYNETAGEDEQLVAAIAVHYEPYGIYPGKTATLEALPDGATITVTNDPSNETRALLLLQEAGLITLPEGASVNDSLTVLDIVGNPKNLTILEIDASQLPSTLADVDLAVINGNFALDAGLSPATDAIFIESPDSEAGVIYTNYVVVRAADAEADWIRDLESVLCSQKVYDFILNNENYKGGVIPAFTPDAE